MTTQPVTFEQAAAALGIVKGDARSKANAVTGRLAALGYDRECGRCGGTGHWSYNQITGTRCFKCEGRKRELLPLTAERLAEAVARQAAGELDGYFAANKARTEAKRALAPLLAAFREEWGKGAVHADYSAAYRSGISAPLSLAAGMVNSIHDATFDISYAVQYGNFSKVDPAAAVERMRELTAMVREVNAAWAAYDGADRLTPRR